MALLATVRACHDNPGYGRTHRWRARKFLRFWRRGQGRNLEESDDICCGDPHVKGILVNIFGGITRGEEVARGVIMAQPELPQGMPVVVRLSGTGEPKGAMLGRHGPQLGL